MFFFEKILVLKVVVFVGILFGLQKTTPVILTGKNDKPNRTPTTTLLLLQQKQQQQHEHQSYSSKFSAIIIPSKQIGVDVHGKSVSIPLIGAGTWQYNDTIAYESLCKAFSVGITFVDTAFGYNNQIGVGEAIQDCFFGNNTGQNRQSEKSSSDRQLNLIRNREDLFVLTKIPGGLTIDETLAAHYHNLQQLKLEYVDHLMIHFPSDWDVTPSRSSSYVRQNQWRALEELYYTNKARSIGVSHYCSQHIDDILAIATVPISINQVEYHVGSQDVDHVIMKCHENNITFMSFSPLCGPCQIDNPTEDSLIDGNFVTTIGKKYNVTGAQVSLRFILQQYLQDPENSPIGPVIPKSNNIDHIRSNMDLFSFELSDDDMDALSAAVKPEAEEGDCDVP